MYNLPAVVVAAVSSPDYSTCGELLLGPRRALVSRRDRPLQYVLCVHCVFVNVSDGA